MQNLLLIYVSRATVVFDRSSLVALAATAAAINRTQGIGGMLLSFGNHFLQVLEGPTDPVLRLTAKIAKDPRHDDMRVLHRESTDAVLFAQWSMAYLCIDESFAIDMTALRDEVQRTLSSGASLRESTLTIIKGFPNVLRQQGRA